MLLDFYFEGKLFGVKILFQNVLKNYVRKKIYKFVKKNIF